MTTSNKALSCLTVNEILHTQFSEIQDIAASVGIDWTHHSNDPFPFKGKAKALDKASKDRVYIHADIRVCNRTGYEFPFITFVNQKASVGNATYSGGKALRALLKGQPTDTPELKAEREKQRIERDKLRDEANAAKEAEEAAQRIHVRSIVINHVQSTFQPCQHSAYLTKKKLTEFKSLFTVGKKISVKTGNIYGNTCIAYPLFNEAYDHVGYEFIEDGNSKNKESSTGSGGGRFASIKGNKPATAPVPAKPAIELSALDCRIVSLIKDGVSTYEGLEKHVQPIELCSALDSLLDKGIIFDDFTSYAVVDDLPAQEPDQPTAQVENIAYVSEGVADMLTIHKATGADCYASISAGQIKKLVNILVASYDKVIVCADNDPNGAGLDGAKFDIEQGTYAVCLPFSFKTKGQKIDFNDVYVEQGLDAVKFQLNNIVHFSSRQNFTENSRYFTLKPVEGAINIMLGEKGTGKTTAIKQILESNPDAKICVISHRVALGSQIAREFDLDFYDDVKAHPEKGARALECKARIVLSPESLSYVDPSLRYDFVIIDESEQLLQHATHSSTMNGMNRRNTQVLRSLCCNAGTVILADANAGTGTNELAQIITENSHKPIVTLQNTYKPRSARGDSFTLYGGEFGAIQAQLKEARTTISQYEGEAKIETDEANARTAYDKALKRREKTRITFNKSWAFFPKNKRGDKIHSTFAKFLAMQQAKRDFAHAEKALVKADEAAKLANKDRLEAYEKAKLALSEAKAKAASTPKPASTVFAAYERALPLEPVVFISDTKANAEYAASIAESQDKKVLLLTSLTMKSHSQELTRDPVSYVNQYDVVCYSPCFGTGFSVDEGHQFTKAFAIFTGSSNTAESCSQMLARFRGLSEYHGCIGERKAANPTNKKTLIELLIQKPMKYTQAQLDISASGEIVIDDFARLYVSSEIERNKSFNDFHSRMLHVLKDEGFTVVKSGDCSDMSAQASEVLKAAKDEQKKADELDTITKANELTEKFGIESDIALEITIKDKKHKLFKKVDNVLIARMEHSTARSNDAYELAQVKQGKLSQVELTHCMARRKLVTSIFKTLGIDPKKLEHTKKVKVFTQKSKEVKNIQSFSSSVYSLFKVNLHSSNNLRALNQLAGIVGLCTERVTSYANDHRFMVSLDSLALMKVIMDISEQNNQIAA